VQVRGHQRAHLVSETRYEPALLYTAVSCSTIRYTWYPTLNSGGTVYLFLEGFDTSAVNYELQVYVTGTAPAACACNLGGDFCNVNLMTATLPLVPGEAYSIFGSTVNKPNYFGYTSGNAWYALPLAAGTVSVYVTTCNPPPSFPTVMWLTSGCPHGPSTVTLDDLGLLASSTAGSCSTIDYAFPSPLTAATTVYVMVQVGSIELVEVSEVG
jgi:hypothetical protein